MHAKYAPQAASAWILKFNPCNEMKKKDSKLHNIVMHTVELSFEYCKVMKYRR